MNQTDRAPSLEWRVILREARVGDAEQIDGWLSEALAAVEGRPPAESGSGTFAATVQSLRPSRRLLVIAGRDSGERAGTPLGLVTVSEPESGVMIIDTLAIAAGERNLGYGAEALYALEDRYEGIQFVAGVPVTNGLAIYFWLRVGYRPLFPKKFTPPPGLPSGTGRIWMQRGAAP